MDDPRYHPSEGIHDAAYPDSSYRPTNNNGAPPPEKGASSPQTQSRYSIFSGGSSATPGQPHHQPQFMATPAPAYQQLAPLSTSNSSGSGFPRPDEHHSQLPTTNTWGADNFLAVNPNLPPPPYIPSRPETAHSSSSPASAAPPSPNLSYGPHTPLHPMTVQSGSARTYLADHAGGDGLNGRLGMLARERRRSRRRMCICACIGLMLFVVAMAVGVGVGVKLSQKKGEKGPEEIGPPH